AWSLDRRAGRVSGEPSADARLGLRLLQLHLCVVYLASGLEKATGIQWWNGEAGWRGGMRPGLPHFRLTWLGGGPWVRVPGGWGPAGGGWRSSWATRWWCGRSGRAG